MFLPNMSPQRTAVPNWELSAWVQERGNLSFEPKITSKTLSRQTKLRSSSECQRSQRIHYNIFTFKNLHRHPRCSLQLTGRKMCMCVLLMVLKGIQKNIILYWTGNLIHQWEAFWSDWYTNHKLNEKAAPS